MGGQIDKNILKKRIIEYVVRKHKEGNQPTYKEIQRTFQCLPKPFFPGGIREIYELAGISYASKFATKNLEEKKQIQQKIIAYVKDEANKGTLQLGETFKTSLE